MRLTFDALMTNTIGGSFSLWCLRTLCSMYREESVASNHSPLESSLAAGMRIGQTAIDNVMLRNQNHEVQLQSRALLSSHLESIHKRTQIRR